MFAGFLGGDGEKKPIGSRRCRSRLVVGEVWFLFVFGSEGCSKSLLEELGGERRRLILGDLFPRSWLLGKVGIGWEVILAWLVILGDDSFPLPF